MGGDSSVVSTATCHLAFGVPHRYRNRSSSQPSTAISVQLWEKHRLHQRSLEYVFRRHFRNRLTIEKSGSVELLIAPSDVKGRGSGVRSPWPARAASKHTHNVSGRHRQRRSSVAGRPRGVDRYREPPDEELLVGVRTTGKSPRSPEA